MMVCGARTAFILWAVLYCISEVSAQQFYQYEIQSQPQGIISTTSGYVVSGTAVPTPDISYGLSSGYYFIGWTINGVGQAGVTGAALTEVTLPMTNDETAVANFILPGDSTGSGLQDWYQWFWFGNTNQTSISDPTGDGFTLFADLERGYSPVIANVTTNGGAIMRLSDSATYIPPTNPQYYYVIESQPQGIITTSSGYVSPGTAVPTPDISYGLSSGYYFIGWTINGVGQAGVTGAALTEVTLPMTNDETAVANFILPGDSTGSGLQDWYQWFWFGNTNQTSISDPTGDGFTLFADLERGYSPVIANVTTNGGAIMRLSDSATYIPPTNPQYYYVIESQPQGIITTSSGYVSPGTAVPTPDISYGLSSGYYFIGWTINGVGQAGVTGAALTEVTLPMTNDETAVANFILPGDSTGSGLQDWYQWFWFGNTNQTSISDPTGDGFTLFADLERGYSPVIANVTTNGGAIMRLSDLATFVSGPPQYYYEIESQPEGIITTTSGYVSPGTAVPTPDISYGLTGSYGFGYWTVNGVRQAGVTGASLTAVTLPMTNDEVAVAVYFPAGDSTGSGLQDWYQEFWFGNTNQTSVSDPTADGFTLFADLERGYSPVIANVTTNGGAIMRLSDFVTFVRPYYLMPPYYQTVTIAFLNGQVVLEWTAGGILQSATNVNGPYTDVVGATSPYTIMPTEGQMFFRVEFPPQ